MTTPVRPPKRDFRVNALLAEPVIGSNYYVRTGPYTAVLYTIAADGTPIRVGNTEYTHVQTSPASTWTINHNMGYQPSIVLLSSGGVQFEGQITHVSNNQAVVTLSVAASGIARCT